MTFFGNELTVNRFRYLMYCWIGVWHLTPLNMTNSLAAQKKTWESPVMVCVLLRKSFSAFQVKQGAPQGLCLGPPLFTAYISKLSEIVQHS